MIQNFIFGIVVLKTLFRAYNIFIFVQTFQWTSSEFVSNFRFSSRKSHSQQKLSKWSQILQYNFAQKTSLILRTSTHLMLKVICPRNTAKNLSDFTNFPADMFLFGVRKNICTTPFLDAQELHLWSNWKQMSVYFYICP